MYSNEARPLLEQQHGRRFSPRSSSLLDQTTSCPCKFTRQVIPLEVRMRNLEDTFLGLI